MIGFAIAVAAASLLGSLHCVGMCGPFALWSIGNHRSPLVVAGYHVGRLSTYLSAGLMAGVIGSTLTMGGEVAGLQSTAAKLAGLLLVLVGLSGLVRRSGWWQQWRRRRRGETVSPAPSKIAGWLRAAGPLVDSRSRVGRAYLGGLLTTWLPCGWLYLFVLVAGGTGSVQRSLWVMLAFWIGTLPALTGLVYGANSLAVRFRSAIPTATSLLLILTGLYTATGRASAKLSEMTPPPSMIEASLRLDPSALTGISDEPLPCCQPKVMPRVEERP